MELSVAVDKLNSMSREDIVAIAKELPCMHIPVNSERCLVANLLREWGVEDPIVGGDYITSDKTTMAYDMPYQVSLVVSDFDNGRI